MNLYFNNEEYFFVKDTKFDGTMFKLFIDSDTKSKIVILDENNNIIMDKHLTNSIMSQVFRKYSEIYTYPIDYGEFEEEDLKIGIEGEEEIPISEERFNEICEKLKKVAFYQFGKDVISEEEIDRRIRENLKTIVIDPNIDPFGQYNKENKKISLKESIFEENLTAILYHEFLHALTFPGTQKIIAFGIEEEYEYGRGIDEGIIAVLQNNKRTKSFTPYKQNLSYPHESELAELIKIVYENTKEAKKDNLNFFDEYIKEPNKTLERVYSIFQQDETYNNHNDLSQKDIDTIGMSKALNLVLKMDELYEADELKKEDIYNEIKNQLELLLINQIAYDFPKDEKDLFNVLYSLEGFQLKSSDNRKVIEEYKKKVIKEFLNQNKDYSIDDLEFVLPPLDRQSDLSEEDQRLYSLYAAITKDYSKADVRFNGINKTILEIKNEENKKKKKID